MILVWLAAMGALSLNAEAGVQAKKQLDLTSALLPRDCVALHATHIVECRALQDLKRGKLEAISQLKAVCDSGVESACRSFRITATVMALFALLWWGATGLVLFLAFRRPEAAQARPYPRIRSIAPQLASLVMVSVAIEFTLTLFGSTRDLGIAWHSAIAFPLTWTLLALLGQRRAGASFSQVFPLKPVPGSWLVACAGLGVGSNILLSEVDNLTRRLVTLPDLMPPELFANPSINLLLFVLSAPLLEELFFRGLVLRGFLLNHRPWVAIAAAAVYFSLVHANPPQLFPTLCLGFALGWLAWRSRSLVPGIVMHVVSNGFALLAPRLHVRGFEAGAAAVLQPVWFDLLGVALVAVALVALARGFAARDRLQAVAPAGPSSAGERTAA